MGAHKKRRTREIEQLFLDGYTYDEIQEIFGMTKEAVVGVIYRARQMGRVPRPVYVQPYDARRNSHIRRGTIGRALDMLTEEQHKHLVEVALGLGMDSLAEMIGSYLSDALAEEMKSAGAQDE